MDALLKQAKEINQVYSEVRATDRYVRTIAGLVGAGVMAHNKIKGIRQKISIEDLLWVGEFEPRVLEILPALIMKKPSALTNARDLPEDLAQVIREIRRGENKTSFRGIPPKQYSYWLDKIGHKRKSPSVMKAFRLSKEDLACLKDCCQKLNCSETESVRQGLRLLLTAAIKD